MAFHPSSDRDIRLRGAEEELKDFRRRSDAAHDFDAPAWLRPDCRARFSNPGRSAPKLIDLERRARFLRLPLDPR